MLRFLRLSPSRQNSGALAEALLYETREILDRVPSGPRALPARQAIAEPPRALPVRFGDFVLHREPLRLEDLEGRVIALQRQPLICLDLLVRKAPRPVSRNEIRDAVWGDDRFVDHDQGINYIVYRIRIALGDEARDPRYVETLPQEGYRLVRAIEARGESPSPERQSWWRRLLAR